MLRKIGLGGTFIYQLWNQKHFGKYGPWDQNNVQSQPFQTIVRGRHFQNAGLPDFSCNGKVSDMVRQQKCHENAKLTCSLQEARIQT